MTPEEIQSRVYAVIAAVAAGGHTDVDPLLDDLDDDDRGSVVHGLAELALRGLMPQYLDVMDPAGRARLAQGLREELLRRQAAGDGAAEGDTG